MKKQTEFERRLSTHYDELKWLYCELYLQRLIILKVKLISTMC